jgi:hypothetical protein
MREILRATKDIVTGHVGIMSGRILWWVERLMARTVNTASVE